MLHVPKSHSWLGAAILDLSLLDPRYSKGGLLTSCIWTIWGLVRNAESQAPVGPTESDPAFQ